ncbi:glycosyltransferase family 4 protein [Pedobacter sp.]|uniref:glycosyltransferase family 4 protein n=1 Tax=Pedobacter sp. TaxID=1411316 RepID=UPI003BA95623
MKIAFFIFHLRSGGAERVMTTLANDFAKLNHEVVIYTVVEEESFYALNDLVKHVKLGIGVRNFLQKTNMITQIIKLFNHLKRNKPDVLISFIDRNNLMATTVGKLLGIPVIISERSNPEKYDFNAMMLFGFKRLYQKANAIVLQTKAVARSFEKMNIILPRKEVIPNPLEPSFLENLDTLQKENIILSVGRLSVEKGHDILLKAAVNSCLENWKIVIVGDGPLMNDYRHFIAENGLVGKIELLGRKTDVINYYSKAKIFVLPSRFEGFPNAILEAMARGCAVVASNCDYGPSEIIKHEINGILFEMGDAEALTASLNKLILDEGLVTKYSQAASSDAERYNTSKISTQWLQVVSSIVK